MIKNINDSLNFNDIFNNDFLASDLGFNSFEKYKTYIENIKPRNIYTNNTDSQERYILENYILNLSLNFLVEKYGIERREIVKAIPEIEEFYPYQSIREYYGFSSFDLDKDVAFKSWAKNLLEDFFKQIDQRQYGEYYTPESLIKLSFDNVQLKASHTVVDPSCGSGFFLLEYLTTLIDKKIISGEDLSEMKHKIYGFDIFPFAIIMTKLILGEYVFKNGIQEVSSFEFPNIFVHNTVNSLLCKNGNDRISKMKFDLIIGNPPFFRIEPNDKNEICSCISYGHNYIHSIFLHWSIQHMSNDGKSILFLPQSILSGYYYQKLRRELLTKSSLDMIVSDKAHEKSFLVQQDIMILYFSKTSPKSSYLIGLPDSGFEDLKTIKLPMDFTDNKNSVIPIFKEKNDLIIAKKLAKNEILEYLEEFEIGTGNFVWNQNKDKIYKEYVEGSIPLIMGPSVSTEGVVLNQSKYNYCKTDLRKYIKSKSLIVYRRMSPIGNAQRMVATVIDTNEIPEYILENHINYISHKNNDIQKTAKMLKFITNSGFNQLINNFCQTNQVSSNDMWSIFETLRSLHK